MATATAPTVFITVPKYVAITPSPLTKIRPAPVTVVDAPIVVPAANNVTASDEGAATPRGKKRRLDHLTWEEKIQRKKLKNRVAAQTSRDRKKARMEEMEGEIQELTQKTEILHNKCESLQAINDSLLEKNRKLDMEVEALRQQLNELQQQQSVNNNNVGKCTTATCAGWLKSNGLTVDARAAAPAAPEKEQHTGVALEDCCPLPTLQDMFLLDEEFDAGKLEELAESLLADITADMEAGDREGDEDVAQAAGGAKRLSGSVVGTSAERLESSQHTHAPSDSLDPRQQQQPQADAPTLQHKLPENQQQQQQSANIITTSSNSNTSQQIAVIPAATISIPPDTVYGTYDAKTNSITIVMDDDAVPVNEAVEEIYSDGMSHDSEDSIKCPTPAASPSQVYLNVVECSDDEEDDLNFDPIESFLRPKRPLVSPLAKSPALSLHSATSDHGYESIMGSPTSTVTDHYETGTEDFSWQHSFNELFPTLI